MKSILVLVVGLLVGTLAVAAPKGVDSAKWDSLLHSVATKGTAMDSYFGTYMTLSQIVLLSPDNQNDHQSDYFSEVGGYDTGGVFQSGHLEIVSEKWVIDANGNWDIDQWLFSTTNEGEVLRAFHIHMIEDIAGHVLTHDYLPFSSEEQGQKLAILSNSWFGFAGVAKIPATLK